MFFLFFITCSVVVGGHYKALYTYDPRVNSPNVDGMDEELAFEKDDIIMVRIQLLVIRTT